MDVPKPLGGSWDWLCLRPDADLSYNQGSLGLQVEFHQPDHFICASNCTKPFLTMSVFPFFSSQSEAAPGESEDNPFQLCRGSHRHINAGVLALGVYFLFVF